MGSKDSLGITTVSLNPTVRDRLKLYRDENEYQNLNAALSALLDEAGVSEDTEA